MAKILVILLSALVLEALGVVLLSQGLKQIGDIQQLSLGAVGRLIARGAANPLILLGVLCEAIFFGALLYLLKRADVSLVWPLTSLGFVLTTTAAAVIGKEHVSPLRWAGVFLIMAGAALVGYSQHRADGSRPAPVAPQSASDLSKG